jgi:Fe-S cluster biosynthesis and repair protein YggX
MGMANLEERIAQWEKMSREAPDDMAFLSLGNAYKEAGRLDEAHTAFARAIELNATMSRAYQFCGETLIDLGKPDESGAILIEGYKVAAARGDVMPQKAIAALLEQIGQELPQVEQAAASGPQLTTDAQGQEMIIDRRTGQAQPRLPDPPMRGPVGQFIFDHFGTITWQQWIGQGTKVINEMALDFSNEQHQDVYDQQMQEWLGITPGEVEAYAQEKAKENA